MFTLITTKTYQGKTVTHPTLIKTSKVFQVVSKHYTFAASTLIILFVQIFNIFHPKKNVKENKVSFWTFRIILVFDMKLSKLINHLTDMCWSPCSMVDNLS
jgi:hypothetical protein